MGKWSNEASAAAMVTAVFVSTILCSSLGGLPAEIRPHQAYATVLT